MSVIRIEGLEIYAHHGFYQEEQKLGGRFLIDLHIKVDTSKAEASDHLEDTLNYQSVVEKVKKQMDIKASLLEHIAARILDEIMKDFLEIELVKIKLSKLNPPINGKIEAVSVEIERNRKS